MTAGGGVDVLAVLDSFAWNSGTASREDAAAARAAIAELIAADREYDEAKDAHEKARKKFRDLDGIEDAWARVLAATARRASALAALDQN